MHNPEELLIAGMGADSTKLQVAEAPSLARRGTSAASRKCAQVGAVRKPARIAIVLMVFLLMLAGWPGLASAPVESPESVIAIGDVHGDFEDFVAILQHTGLVNKQNHWTGNKTTLVQLGDTLDRGPQPREVLDLLMALQEEAPRAGGRVVPLLGNHEMMNIMGDLRYVTAANYGSFADSRSEQRRHAAYQQYAKWRTDHAELLAGVPQLFQEKSEAEWDSKHAAGFVEQREAFSPDGKYGKWLRGNAAVAKVGEVVFLHGGISPVLATVKLEEINRLVHREITTFDTTKKLMIDKSLILPFFTLDEMTAVAQAELAKLNSPRPPPSGANTQMVGSEHMLHALQDFLGYGEWLSVKSDGPLWFRGYAQWKEEGNAEHAANLLRTIGTAHIVVGHTPQKDGRIQSRFDGKIFLIDTGMLSSYFGGRASALEIRGDKFTAEYMDKKIVLLDQGVGTSRSNAVAPPSR